MSFENIPSEIIMEMFAHGNELRLNKNLDKIYNRTQYNIYSKEYKLLYPGEDIPKYDDNVNYFREINILYYNAYCKLMIEKYSWLKPARYNPNIDWKNKYTYNLNNPFPPPLNKPFTGKQLNINDNFSIIPEEIGELIIKRLIINNSRIKIIPEEIGNITELTYLIIVKHNIIKLPKEIANLPKLKELSLNSFTEFPEEFKNLKSLNILSLFYSLIEVPTFIGHLDNLEYLTIRYTDITKIPDFICNFENLSFLDLRDNKISDISEEIYKLSKLGYCYLSRNRICKFPVSFKNLKSINLLDVHTNSLYLDKEVEFPISLVSLDLSYNNLDEIPLSIGKNKNLVSLNLSGNHMIKIPEFFKNLMRLKHLELRKSEYLNDMSVLCNLPILSNVYLDDNDRIKIPHCHKNIIKFHR